MSKTLNFFKKNWIFLTLPICALYIYDQCSKAGDWSLVDNKVVKNTLHPKFWQPEGWGEPFVGDVKQAYVVYNFQDSTSTFTTISEYKQRPDEVNTYTQDIKNSYLLEEVKEASKWLSIKNEAGQPIKFGLIFEKGRYGL